MMRPPTEVETMLSCSRRSLRTVVTDRNISLRRARLLVNIERLDVWREMKE